MGTLPIRGDLAHIALADEYLVAHYVVPQPREIGPDGAALLCQPREGSDEVTRLAPGAAFDALTTAAWLPLLPETKLRPHHRHIFTKQLLMREPVSHVRLNIFPDGGVSRLRVHGRVELA